MLIYLVDDGGSLLLALICTWRVVVVVVALNKTTEQVTKYQSRGTVVRTAPAQDARMHLLFLAVLGSNLN